jgi:hypothetical protein
MVATGIVATGGISANAEVTDYGDVNLDDEVKANDFINRETRIRHIYPNRYGFRKRRLLHRRQSGC